MQFFPQKLVLFQLVTENFTKLQMLHYFSLFTAYASVDYLAQHDLDWLAGRDIWLLTHADLRNTTRVRVFLDFMAKAISVHRDLLEGRCPITAPALIKQAKTRAGKGKRSRSYIND